MKKLNRLAAVMLSSLAMLSIFHGADAAPAGNVLSKSTAPGWPSAVQKVSYLSSADNTRQPALFYKPTGDKPVPLLVALHTWSGDYLQPEPAYAKWCMAKSWAFVHPHFRGPNNTPDACGSELVVKDIISVVDYARQNTKIDPDRIYLVGASGGGYAAMLLAGRAPQIWAGVSEWCGIFDLRDWYQQTFARNLNYADMTAKCCGGVPGSTAEVDAQFRNRSARTYFAEAKGVPMDLNTGIFDGHKGSVPTSQTLEAFNCLAAPEDRLAAADIAYITQQSKIPDALKKEINDPLYSGGKALLRNRSGNTRVTVFEGAHTILYEAALAWLEQQRKGKPPVWYVPAVAIGNPQEKPTEIGK